MKKTTSIFDEVNEVEDRDAMPAVLAPRELPDPKVVLADLRQSIVGATWFQQQMRENEELRVCYWAGQTSDGRKHGTVHEPARPWENAADHRVHLVQELMNERTAVRLRAVKSAKIGIKGRTMGDQKRAALLKQVVDYHMNTEMGEMPDDETKYFSNWCQNYGHAVMYTGWQLERQLEARTLKLPELQQAWAVARLVEEEARLLTLGQRVPDEAAAQEIEQAAYEEALVMLEGDVGRKQLCELVLEMDPDLKEMGKKGYSEAMRAVAKLRGAQEATYFAPFVRKSCPLWEALQPMVDVFYPTETRKLSEARWIARVRWMTKVQLLSWAEQEKLDEDWVREVLNNPGKCMDVTGLAEWVLGAAGTRLTTKIQGAWGSEDQRHYQVIELYWRAFTPYRVPVLYRTIAHGKVQSGFGKHEVCKAYHGEYPFHDLREEHWDKLILSSRGVPELVGTAQQAVKAQWDGRTNTASITTVPPLLGPPGSTRPPLGPGVYLEQPRAGGYEWLQPPPPDSRSIEIEATVINRVNRLYGRIDAGVPEPLQVLLQGMLADDTLKTFRRILTMTVQLIQQYTPVLQGQRITGTNEYVTATREEIQGLFDIEVTWDVRDLSLDWVEQKLKFYTDLLIPLDNRGIIDRGAMIQVAAEAVDPQAAARFVRAEETAARVETEEESNALNTIFSGGLPPFVVGVNHELRAQIMTEDLQQSPVRQRLMATSPEIAAVWEDRLQKHLFQVEQEANKQAGIEGGSDPLRQSPLAQLKAGGWQGVIGVPAAGGGLP